jgi:hypothetical protein
LVEIPKVFPNLDQTFIMALAILLANPPKIFAAAKKCDPPKVKTRCQQIVAAQGMVRRVHVDLPASYGLVNIKNDTDSV